MVSKTFNPLDKKLLLQLDPNLNQGIDPKTIAAYSGKKYWWLCDNGHSFSATASHRTQGSGCSYCSGKQLLFGFNDLATADPDIAAQWHPTKNGDLLPTEVIKSSKRKVWWQCEKGHEWENTILSRTYYKTGCLVCNNRILLAGFNDIETTHPHIAKKWVHDLNKNLKPNQITKGYAKKVWLYCDNNHEVNVLISNCLEKINCVYCSGKKVLEGYNDIATTHPFLIKFWHPDLNKTINPNTVTRGYGKKAWWTCINGHEYESLISNRINVGDRCSYCDGQKLITGENDLATRNPTLAKQWHPTLNNNLTPKLLTQGSNRKVWWLCSNCGEAWQAIVANRVQKPTNRGCPTCAGKKIKNGYNDLATLFPKIAEEIHPTKNNKLIPSQIAGKELTAGKDLTLWWLCDNGHEYKAKIHDRTYKNQGCNKCYHLELPTNSTSFITSHPDLLKEWDKIKNASLKPENVATHSSKKVWWVCEEGHSWEAIISNRTRYSSGCPTCWKSKNYSLAEKEIGQFLEKMDVKIEYNTRKYLDGKEIDIYLPEYNFGIEYNGLYWHSEAAGKNKKYHQLKTELAKKNNIELFQIWEDDWVEKKDIILRHIAYKIGKLKNIHLLFPEIDPRYGETFFARKLKVETISYNEASLFLNETHIQGLVKGSYYFGLKTLSNQLCAVMVLSKTDQPGEILISRYSTKGIVPGGFSKLLKHATTKINPQKIITFADLAISNGSLYEQHGFIVEKNLAPDYMYIKNKKRYHKFGFRLKAFQNNKTLIFYPNMTEKELAEINGYTRIWDAGKIKYSITLNNMADKN